MNMVFIDASAWIALYHKRDKYHKSAWLTYEQLLNRSRKFLTTNWVVYEAITILITYLTVIPSWIGVQDDGQAGCEVTRSDT